MDKNRGEGKILAKVICVLLSFGLWLYVTNIENPIKTNEVTGVYVEVLNSNQLYKNNLALSPNQKFTVDIKIEGKANDVYRTTKNDFKVVVDLSAYALKKGENIVPVEIISSPDNISIKANTFLGIKVNIEELKGKEFKLSSDIRVFYRDGIYENESTIAPQKIKVEGAASQVNKVSKVALVGEVKDVSEGFKKTFPIKAFDDSGNEVTELILSETEGTYEVKVSEGKKVQIKAKTVGNLKEGLILEEIELSKTTVEIAGNKEALKTITYLETETIDISSLTQTKEYSLKIVLPQGVRIVNGNEYVTVKVKISDSNISKEFEVPTTFTGTADNNKVEADNNKVKIKVSGPSSIINSLTANDFTANISVVGKVLGEYEEAPKVILNNQNPAVKIDIMSKIKYTITVK